MATVILYTIEDNKIQALFADAISYAPDKVTFVGGLSEGYDPKVVGTIITDDIISEFRMIDTMVTVYDDSGNPQQESQKVNTLVFVDQEGNLLQVGDDVPLVADIKSQFIIVSGDDQRLADLELMITELLMGGM